MIGHHTMTTEQSPKDKILAFAAKHNLVAQWVFVPFSQSRNAKEKYPSLNWRYTLGSLKGDYTQGSAHCPAYKASVKELEGSDCIMRDEAIRAECETGRRYNKPYSGFDTAKLPEPTIDELLYCLVMDASAIDHPTFVTWAREYGYDTDSRKAEETYKQCLAIGLAFHATLGDTGLRELQEACQDY